MQFTLLTTPNFTQLMAELRAISPKLTYETVAYHPPNTIFIPDSIRSLESKLGAAVASHKPQTDYDPRDLVDLQIERARLYAIFEHLDHMHEEGAHKKIEGQIAEINAKINAKGGTVEPGQPAGETPILPERFESTGFTASRIEAAKGLGITTVEQLVHMGVDGINAIPYISDDNAKKIFDRAKELLG